MQTSHRLFAPLAALALLLPACDVCTSHIEISVTLTLLSSTTEAPIDEASVSYRLGQDGERVECAQEAEGLFYCGEEVSGTLHIEIEAPGYMMHSESVDVVDHENGCHVVGRELEVRLQPL